MAKLLALAVPPLLALFVTQAGAQSATPLFVPLGDLQGGVFHSSASAISGDGTVVVGESAARSGIEAFRWTSADGMVALGTLYAGGESRAFGVAADGSVIVGGVTSGTPGSPGTFALPFLWTPAGGIVDLGGFPGVARGVSADGSVVVGVHESVGGFIWTQANGFVPSGVADTQAVSGDGAVVVADAPATRCDALGCAPLIGGAPASSAAGLSHDGSVVVGSLAPPAAGGAAFRWTQAAGASPLDSAVPSGFRYSRALGVSADGSVVVGERDYGAAIRPSGSSLEAFAWTASAGMRRLEELLVVDYGVDLQGFVLQRASAVSADGRTIVGSGLNLDGDIEAWLVFLPQPILPYPDQDGDGSHDLRDNCSAVPNPSQSDADSDGIGDACNDASDADQDEWSDLLDNCLNHFNPGQNDADQDRVGDACNDASDADQDEWSDLLDNCLNSFNPGQNDADQDRAGDLCDPFRLEADHETAQCFVDLGDSNAALFQTLVDVVQARATLANCLARRVLVDADADHEDDSTDRCRGTAAGAPVDADGCARAQFCAARSATCTRNDWLNDQPGTKNPRDCTYDKRSRSCS